MSYEIDIYCIKDNQIVGDVTTNRGKKLFDILVKEFVNQNLELATKASNIIFETEDDVEDLIYNYEHCSYVNEMPIKIDMELLNEMRKNKALSEREIDEIEYEFEYGCEIWAILNEYKK